MVSNFLPCQLRIHIFLLIFFLLSLSVFEGQNGFDFVLWVFFEGFEEVGKIHIAEPYVFSSFSIYYLSFIWVSVLELLNCFNVKGLGFVGRFIFRTHFDPFNLNSTFITFLLFLLRIDYTIFFIFNSTSDDKCCYLFFRDSCRGRLKY